MIPLGAAFGGVLVWVVEQQVDREWALRATWFAQAAVIAACFVFGRAKLTTEKLETARVTATPSSS